jgi:hypothetical protein
MKSWGVVFLVCGAAWGQDSGLQKRVPVAPVVIPAALVVPATREMARPGNSNGDYAALRGRIPNGTTYAVKDVVLKRDAGVITLASGTVTLFREVAGKVTGAVFEGEGTLHLEPPTAMERRLLKAVMKTEVLDQRFTNAVFEFTDGTAEELKSKGVAGASAPGEVMGRAGDTRDLFRRQLEYNLEARLLEDLGKPGSGGFFMAEMKGPMFSKRLIYVVDPRGALAVAPEEVGLLTSGMDGYDVTLGFRDEAHRKTGKTAGAETAGFRIGQQTIDATIEKNGKLTATTVTAVTAGEAGMRVVPLELFPTLRVSGVWGPSGEALDFIQEDKLHDAAFAVILKKPLAAGETVQITTEYAGKEAVAAEGGDNYFLRARESWYPNMRGQFGNYAWYRMTFHTDKAAEVVATGNRVSDVADGKMRTSVWQTQTPLAVAGFNLGEFRRNASEQKMGVQVVSFTNTQLSDRYQNIANSGGPFGGLSTKGMMAVATSEGDAAVQIYTDFFGPLPYDHVYLTEQTACNFGQSWPMLVYLPICYFWDDTVQHFLGLLNSDPTYWKVVTAHEVAHQWWGQTVGFASYRDQWMSEGFANFSASLYLKETRKDSKEYRDFWTLLRRRLLEKNEFGYRAEDVGPVVMGERASSSKTGEGVYQALVYNKGAYILHSLEMLFWTSQNGEGPFKRAMHDFVAAYTNKPATTEDFKAAMEKDMPPWLDLDKNHKLDWFFDAYVYGTEVPKYKMTYDFSEKDGGTVAHFKLEQSGVGPDFRMLVPVYLELEDKRVLLMGKVPMIGNQTIEKTVNMGKSTSPPKRIVVNYNFDLLAE